MPKRYNTPHRSRVVKTRLSEDEYADFTARLAPYGISQSEFLRQAIRRTTIRPIIHVSAVNDELLSAVGKLTAEYGRIGGSLNQIARYLNEYGAPYHALSGEVRAAIAVLAALTAESDGWARYECVLPAVAGVHSVYFTVSGPEGSRMDCCDLTFA